MIWPLLLGFGNNSVGAPFPEALLLENHSCSLGVVKGSRYGSFA